MAGFAEAVQERVRAARAAVEAARAADDPYALAVAEDELDDAVRVAHNIGVGTGTEQPPAGAEVPPAHVAAPDADAVPGAEGGTPA